MLISVIVLAYNRKEFVQSALSSVIHQTLGRECYEIILVSNFSYAEIDEFCERNNVRKILLEGSIGEYISKGIEESRGDIITFLEDDDEFTKEKLETLLALYNDQEYDLIRNSFVEMDASGKAMKSSVQHKTSFSRPLTFNFVVNKRNISRSTLRFMLARGQDFNLSCMSISRRLGAKIRESISRISTCPDGTIFFLALDLGNVSLFSPVVMSRYRVHDSKSRSFSSFETAMLKLEKDGLDQAESLSKIKDKITNRNIQSAIDGIIASRKIRAAVLNPLDRRIGLISIPEILITLSYGSFYNALWVFLFALSIFPVFPVRKAIFRYLGNIQSIIS